MRQERDPKLNSKTPCPRIPLCEASLLKQVYGESAFVSRHYSILDTPLTLI